MKCGSGTPKSQTKEKTLGDAGSSPPPAPPPLAPSCQLRWGVVYVCLGRGVGGEGVVCANVCSHCPKVFPVATSATPALFQPRPRQDSPAFGAQGSYQQTPAPLSEPEKGVEAAPQRKLRDSPQGCSPHQPFSISKSPPFQTL